MNNRPFILTGNIYLSNKEYIIGKVIKNRNVEDKEKCVQILKHRRLLSSSTSLR